MHRKLIMESKLNAIDFAFDNVDIKSVAELGCTWDIDCAYGVYAAEKYGLDRIAFVDMEWPHTAVEKCNATAGGEIIKGNFGDNETSNKVGNVDAVILFWVLLHQVRPDWDKVLEMYAEKTNCFIIANPQWNISKDTIRLLDLGEEEYFKNVPAANDHSHYVELFKNIDNPAPSYTDGRKLRDAHYIWQWGITNNDLVKVLERLGFEMIYCVNNGQFGSLENFHDYTFVFVKKNKE